MLKVKHYNYTKKNFSIILPVLNEEENIKKLIFLIKKNLKKYNYNYEIIFVDDNSTDKTGTIIKEYSSKKVRYFLRKKNKDLTLSCFLGIEKSKNENIIIMDSDLQHDPKYLPKIVTLYFKKKSDFVVGVRNFDKSTELGFLRKIGSIFLSKIFNYFLGYKLSDPMAGYFMFNKKIYHKYKNVLYSKGWKILADLIYNNEDFCIHEIQIKFLKRIDNKSKMNIQVLIDVIKLFFFKLIILKKFL